MRKYESGIDAEISGSVLLSITEAIEFKQFSDLFYEILQKYKVEKIIEDQWYPRQLYFDLFLKLLEKSSGTVMTNLVSIGMSVANGVELPDDIDASNLKSVLRVLNDFYGLAQRNLPDEDIGYEIEQVSPTHIRVTDHTPYPSDSVYGYIYGLVKRFKSDDIQPTVYREYSNPNDEYECPIYFDVKW